MQNAECRRPHTFCILHSAFCIPPSSAMRTAEESHTIIEKALAAARTEADALFVSTDQNITRFAHSNVHQNMSEVSAELTLRVIVDDAVGVASTTVFDDEEIARV